MIEILRHVDTVHCHHMTEPNAFDSKPYLLRDVLLTYNGLYQNTMTCILLFF